jgi:hypothetical protein
MVRDQGVGGSNPLSPTIYDTYSQSISRALTLWRPRLAATSAMYIPLNE